MAFDIACYIDGDRNDSDNQWSHVANHFQARQLYTFTGARGKPFANAVAVSQASDLPGTLVLISPAQVEGEIVRPHRGTEPLVDFLHPADCCYLFGADHLNIDLDIEPAHAVYIDYPGDLEMFSWVAAAVVLHDRLSKLGG